MDYKERIEAAKEQLKAADAVEYKLPDSAHAIRIAVYAIYPELKESEDEKIRKALLESFEYQIKESHPDKEWICGVKLKEIVAWLEKQKEPELSEDLGEYVAELSKQFTEVSFAKLSRIAVRVKNWLEKQNVNKLNTTNIKNCIGMILTDADEQRFKDYNTNLAVCLAWLKRQGEEKPVISNDALREGIAHFGITQYQIDNWLKGYVDVEKQGEQRPINETDEEIVEAMKNTSVLDMIEPKFKVGDWIIRSAEGFKHNTYLITEVKDYYVCEELKGRRVTFTFNDVHKNFKLWNISDAKEGDVLVVPHLVGSEHSEQIFIFKEIKDREYVKNAVEYYCRCMDNEFATNEHGFMGQSDDHFIPANKEQCDILFQKMHKAGYEWDTEKKELKKIEQTSDWSEEDECYMSECIGAIATKDGWSFEEKRRTKHWLESLRPHKQWKPSDEQMDALYTYIYNPQYFNSPDPRMELVESVYNDLKKLKGE